MDTNQLITELVGTYRELNMKYRLAENSPEAREIVKRMRDDEAAFSQALKDRITGIGSGDGDKIEVIHGDDDSLKEIISQFGSARATTLNLLKGITDESVWDNPIDDDKSIRQHVQDLAESDRKQLERLASTVPA